MINVIIVINIAIKIIIFIIIIVIVVIIIIIMCNIMAPLALHDNRIMCFSGGRCRRDQNTDKELQKKKYCCYRVSIVLLYSCILHLYINISGSYLH